MANRRQGEALWDHVRGYTLPESLDHKLRLFASRGHVPYYKDGFFSRDSWLAVLFGQGLEPRHYDRLADLIPLDELFARLLELHARVASHVDAMPTHADFIARYSGEAHPVRRAALKQAVMS